MREKIKTMSDQELDEFILGRLGFDGTVVDGTKIHLRFDMSGISDPNFKWIKENKDIWDLFIDCGLYDRVCLFYMDTYKGNVHLFYKWFEDNDYLYKNGETHIVVIDFTNDGTREIIKRTLQFFCVDTRVLEMDVRRID